MNANKLRIAVLLANVVVLTVCLAVIIYMGLAMQPDERWRIGCSILVGFSIALQVADTVWAFRMRRMQEAADERMDRVLAEVARRPPTP